MIEIHATEDDREIRLGGALLTLLDAQGYTRVSII